MLDLILEFGNLSDNRLALLLLLGIIVTLGHGTEDIINSLGSTKVLVYLAFSCHSGSTSDNRHDGGPSFATSWPAERVPVGCSVGRCQETVRLSETGYAAWLPYRSLVRTPCLHKG